MLRRRHKAAIAALGLAVISLLVFASGAVSKAQAGPYITVSELRGDCLALRRVENGRASATDPTLADTCSGYLLGFSDGMVTQAVATRQRSACRSYSRDADQLALAFLGWADRHPERWQGPAGTGLFAALTDAGLCAPPGHRS